MTSWTLLAYQLELYSTELTVLLVYHSVNTFPNLRSEQ
jgi:hypothetical protein